MVQDIGNTFGLDDFGRGISILLMNNNGGQVTAGLVGIGFGVGVGVGPLALLNVAALGGVDLRAGQETGDPHRAVQLEADSTICRGHHKLASSGYDGNHKLEAYATVNISWKLATPRLNLES